MRYLFRALLRSSVILGSGCQPQISPRQMARVPAASDHAELVQAAEHFLRVFDNMEWEPFRAAWSSAPSVFFPFRDTPERVDGAAVSARFRAFFNEVKATREGPPYLRLTPLQFRAEVMGSAGLVTFMIGRAPDGVWRRTLLFVREGGQWKLAHMHASNAEPVAP
jgi:hypothetical protein